MALLIVYAGLGLVLQHFLTTAQLSLSMHMTILGLTTGSIVLQVIIKLTDEKLATGSQSFLEWLYNLDKPPKQAKNKVELVYDKNARASLIISANASPNVSGIEYRNNSRPVSRNASFSDLNIRIAK